VMVPHGKGLAMKHKPRHLHDGKHVPIGRTFLAALLRQVSNQITPEADIRAAVKKAREDERKIGAKQLESALRKHEEQEAKITAFARVAAEILGVGPHSFDWENRLDALRPILQPLLLTPSLGNRGMGRLAEARKWALGQLKQVEEASTRMNETAKRVRAEIEARFQGGQ